MADRSNNRIVEISPLGSGFSAPVTILSGLSGPAGVATDWNGNVILSDTGSNRILMLPITSSGFGTVVTLASGLNIPMGVAVDSAANVYVADSGNNRIVELPLTGGIYGAPVVVSTGFNNPMGVAIDSSKTLYIADTGNARLVKEAFTSGSYPVQQPLFNNQTTPVGIAVDKNDDVYLADAANNRVLEITWFQAAGRYQSELTIGSGFTSPAGMAIDPSGKVYITDSVSDQVTQVVSGSLSFDPVSLGSSGTPLTYDFTIPAGTTLGSAGIYMQGASGKDFVDAGGSTCVAQTYSVSVNCSVNVKFTPLAPGTRLGAVTLFDANDNPLATAFLSGVGIGPRIAVLPGATTRLGAQLSAPSGVAVDGSGNVYIADSGNNRVVELPWTGSGYGPQTTVPVTGLINPMGLAVDAAGNLYIASNGNSRVVKLPWTGSGFGSQTKVGTGLNAPMGVTVDRNGEVYITDTLNGRIDEIAWTGSGYSIELGGGDYHKAPTGIAVDANGNVYFTDPYQSAISEVPWTAAHYQIQVDLLSIQVTFPVALAVDSNCNLYAVDTGNNRVIMLPWTGTGLGKQITVASGFNSPSGIAVSANNHLFVADTGNNRIVEIDMSTPLAMNFADTYVGSTSVDSAKVAIVENVGNAPLVFNSVAYPADFPEGIEPADACSAGTSLGPNQWCELDVSFVPSVTGSQLAESVDLSENSLGITGSQISIPAMGTSLGKLTQTINFPQASNVIYTTSAMALSATASSGLPVSFAVMSGPATLLAGGKSLRLTGIGTVVISAMQVGNSVYGAAAPVELSIAVAPAPLIVTPQNATAVYGSVPTSFSYSISGFASGDSASTAVTGKPVIVASASGILGAGTYVLTASRGTLVAANYSFVFVPGTLTVAKARINVVAYSVIHSYGAAVKPLTWLMSGFVNGDTASVVTGAPVLTTTANSGASVGSYLIVVSIGTLAAANYSFVGVNGPFIIQPALLTVTPTSQAMTYGRAIPALTYSISGFMNGDIGANIVHGVPSISTTAAPGSTAGQYTISASQGTLSAVNYTFKFSVSTLTIAKAVLWVGPNDASMTYGGKAPALTYSLAGFVNGDTAANSVTGVPAISSVASSSIPGSYTILSRAGTLASANYTFSFGVGTLSIGKAVLMVTAKSTTMTYGASLPALAYAYSGFLNGDGNSAVQGAPLLAATANSKSPAGSYIIDCAPGTLASQDYTFKLVSGTLTINKAVIAVKGVSLAMTYGSTPPGLSYQLGGFVNGDSAATVSGSASLSSGVTASTAAGTYPILVAAGSLSAKNYSFTFANGTMTVRKATLNVAAANQSMTYGTALPTLTYTIAGFVNGDSQKTAIAGAPVISTQATAGSGCGSYLIAPALGSLASQNYTFGFTPALLQVNKAVLTVAANNLSMQVGGTPPALTYTTSGWANGDTPATVLAGAPFLISGVTTASKPGTYSIVVAQGSLRAVNYQFNLINGTFTVAQPSGNQLRIIPGPPRLPILRRVPVTPSMGNAGSHAR